MLHLIGEAALNILTWHTVIGTVNWLPILFYLFLITLVLFHNGMTKGVCVCLKKKKSFPVFWCILTGILTLLSDYTVRKNMGKFCNYIQSKCLGHDHILEIIKNTKV